MSPPRRRCGRRPRLPSRADQVADELRHHRGRPRSRLEGCGSTPRALGHGNTPARRGRRRRTAPGPMDGQRDWRAGSLTDSTIRSFSARRLHRSRSISSDDSRSSRKCWASSAVRLASRGDFQLGIERDERWSKLLEPHWPTRRLRRVSWRAAWSGRTRRSAHRPRAGARRSSGRSFGRLTLLVDLAPVHQDPHVHSGAVPPGTVLRGSEAGSEAK